MKLFIEAEVLSLFKVLVEFPSVLWQLSDDCSKLINKDKYQACSSGVSHSVPEVKGYEGPFLLFFPDSEELRPVLLNCSPPPPPPHPLRYEERKTDLTKSWPISEFLELELWLAYF